MKPWPKPNDLSKVDSTVDRIINTITTYCCTKYFEQCNTQKVIMENWK